MVRQEATGAAPNGQPPLYQKLSSDGKAGSNPSVTCFLMVPSRPAIARTARNL